MYRFLMSKSGRCYVVRDNKLFRYDPETRGWVASPSELLTWLRTEPRVKQVQSEDDFPIYARRAFRAAFQFDSRRVRPTEQR
jgi:hypothetical protein